ncbi:vasodilator-stimulated phosphoprotein [Oryzias melastigma]|uniref:vasodilator-stimulated phosphoprotein n=1 Tax=Oryzias melastigma TaxID=30732 RepID=UPI000CF80821|nr:vasodilator-stimulated phosphoprotein [Oryzias melastigma]
MGEMSAILARRRKAADKPVVKKEETDECDSSVSKSSVQAEANPPRDKCATMPRLKSSINTQRDSSPSSSPVTCQSPTSAATPASRLKTGKKTADGADNSPDMERFKQEIIEEVRKEIQKMKEEIITAMIQEMQKANLEGEVC